MSIAHGAQYASAPLPLPIEDADGEPIGEGFEYIGERLTVLAVAARIMVRRNPNDVYARSIARETLRLAGAMREALHSEDAASASARAPGVVETTLAAVTVTPSDATHTPHTPHTPAPPASPSSAPPATPDTTPATRRRARGSARASASLTSSSSKRKGGAV